MLLKTLYAIAELETSNQSVYDYASGSDASLNLIAVYTDFLHTLRLIYPAQLPGIQGAINKVS